MRIPRARVTAKPRIGPEVGKKDQFKGLKRIKAVMRVAMLASLMESQARPKPSSRATGQARPARISSFMRSKMRMLLSTAMPTERIKPAIPGRVRVMGMSL